MGRQELVHGILSITECIRAFDVAFGVGRAAFQRIRPETFVFGDRGSQPFYWNLS